MWLYFAAAETQNTHVHVCTFTWSQFSSQNRLIMDALLRDPVAIITTLTVAIVTIYYAFVRKPSTGKDVTHNMRARATIDHRHLYHKLVPYSGWHERNWSGIFLENNWGIFLLLQSYDLISILIRKIYLRSHGNFFICFHDFQQQWSRRKQNWKKNS